MTQTEALKRIAAYPFSRAEELSVEQMREIAREALANHIEDNLTMVAQPKQEPVADVLIDHEDEDGHAVMWLRDYALNNGRHLLYTTPPQRTWVGLMDEEKSDLWEISRAALPRYATYASLVEAKLKEKNQ